MTERESKEDVARRIDEAGEKMRATVEVDGHTPHFGPELPVKSRVESVLAAMTMEEKIAMLGGDRSMGIRGLERLGLQTIWCADASSGVRCFGPGLAFPALMGMTASWNRDLIREVGRTIGEECRAVGVSILLGPGVNICRVPTCGRNFEYMGEDPLLTSEMVVPYIQGVQSRGVAATVKHFACNNSDYDRHRMNAIVDKRTLHEIYLPAFRAAVQKGGVKCVMSSYNPLNGTYTSENEMLLTEVLKKEWGFEGLVMSDWNSVYSTNGPVKAGLDLEMPSGVFMTADQILPRIATGELTAAMIDDKIKRILSVFFEMGFYDRDTIDASVGVRTDANVAVARRMARESIVLLKNQGDVLPLVSPARIVLLGPNASDTPMGGGGAAYVRVDQPVSFADGLRTALEGQAEVEVMAGGASEFDVDRVRGADAAIVCVGFDHILESENYDRTWELPDGQDELIRQVAALNPNTVVLITAGAGVETESWIDRVPAVLHTFYLGQVAGTATADILLGRANPSGKLPFTMAKKWTDHPATANYVSDSGSTSESRIKGPEPRRKSRELLASELEKMPREDWPVEYEEGLFVGYRHFDTSDVEPQFPFGYGLSYTRFELADVALSTKAISSGEELSVTATVRNVGGTAGAEVIQVYVQDVASSLPRPVKELKAFAKVLLEAGCDKQVTLKLTKEHLQFYDPSKSVWVAEPGLFRIHVGTSSRQIVFTAEVEYRG